MFLNSQQQTIQDLLISSLDGIDFSPTVDPTRPRQILMFRLLEPRIIGAYVENYLSNKQWKKIKLKDFSVTDAHISIGEDHLAEAEKFLEQNPYYAISLTAITEILDRYAQDLSSQVIPVYDATLNDLLHFSQSKVNKMKEENSFNNLVRELMPQIIQAFPTARERQPEPEDFKKGLDIAFQRSAFGENLECPFGRRISSIFAINPKRVSPSKVIIDEKSHRGALPTFIYREVAEGYKFERKFRVF